MRPATTGAPEALPPVVIIGAGGHGRQCFDVLRAMAEASGMHREVLGFLDDGRADDALLARMGTAHLGGTDLLATLPTEVEVVVGVADPAVRARLDRVLLDAGRTSPRLVHPRAGFGSLVELGPGALVSTGAFFDTHIVAGRQCHVNANASVGHDSILGDHVTILPGARISGAVRLGDRVTVSSNAVVLPGVEIGEGTVVGAGAVVRDDLPPDLVYTGLLRRR